MEKRIKLSLRAATVLSSQLAKGIQGAHFSTWGDLDDMIERSVVLNGDDGVRVALPKPVSMAKQEAKDPSSQKDLPPTKLPPVLDIVFSEKQFRIARDALITLGSAPVRGQFLASPEDLGGTAVLAEFYKEFNLGGEE